MKHVAGVLCALAWIAGIVLAAGWWKLAALFVPFYAWYLFVERLMQVAGLLP